MAKITSTSIASSLRPPVPGAAREHLRRSFGAARQVLLDHRVFLIVAGIYIGVVHIAGALLGWSGTRVTVRSQLMASWWVAIAAVALWAAVRLCVRRHRIGIELPQLPMIVAWPAAARRFWSEEWTLERLLGFVLATQVLSVTAGTFMGWKAYVAHAVGFRFDTALMRLDHALHLGNHPWEVLDGVLGSAILTRSLDVLYLIPWLALTTVVPIAVALSRPSQRRTQFLVGYVLLWAILGSGVATIVTAAGPCYYEGIVGGANPYSAQVAALRENSGTFALGIQDRLWQDYLALGKLAPFGISAFPSLHVGGAAFISVAAWHLGWVLRLVTVTFTAVILVGSVHLGWHYAVDGYFSILFAPLIWHAAGRLTGRETGGSRQRWLIRLRLRSAPEGKHD